ncbi:MAG: pantetheine-phosphate adenylyltransferase [Candidatus Methanomethylicia archaeon]|nr:pantetheine-phosphate adenylyltransferase [Candidatus Methanomethylicia archaeon]MCX8169114.1 pantetheine-phosphate adenylyltransferase [Candidatus Methanomethylicia archaeon]MDW7988846.1 pantetheine-phosphate adenylyltransferase [Nitrososphaerota archaeon]
MKIVAVGGTFDNLHLGHIQLLSKSFEIGDITLIGITSDNFAKRKNHEIEPLKKRENNLKSFLYFYKLANNAKIIILNDPYGPTIDDNEIKIFGIIVSEETLKRAIDINKVRKNKYLPPLKIFVIPLVKDVDLRPLSSTKLRRGERICEKFLQDFSR